MSTRTRVPRAATLVYSTTLYKRPSGASPHSNLVTAMSLPRAPNCCAHCGTRRPHYQMYLCPCCGSVRYCGKDCQRAHAADPAAYELAHAERPTLAAGSDLDAIVIANPFFRRVLDTNKQAQVVAMSLLPADPEVGRAAEDLPYEVHAESAQFFRVVSGRGTIAIGEATPAPLDGDGAAAMVPAGVRHEVRVLGDHPLKFYVIYAPPHHPANRVHRRAADALRDEEGGST